MSNKGELNGTCNMSSCKTGDKATWYNHGSRAYYCKSCATRLNTDPLNARDAERLFGHDLCTEVEPKLHESLIDDNKNNSEEWRCHKCGGEGFKTDGKSKVWCKKCLRKQSYPQFIRTKTKIGRNQLCICGSGFKSKKCCARKG